MDLARQTPANRAALCAALRSASDAGRRVRIAGGGSGGRAGLVAPPPDEIATTAHFDRIIAHEPADLIVTVEAGVPVRRLQEALATHGQTWIQAPDVPGATVGGLLARAASGHRRLRYGAIRDSLLQVVIATGDGRLVQAGGKTVKGVAGYDIPRLVVGARGTLGVIVEATLKLWPLPSSRAWFTAEGRVEELAALGERVRRHVHQPAAILLGPGRLDIELIGPAEDLVAPPGMSRVRACAGVRRAGGRAGRRAPGGARPVRRRAGRDRRRVPGPPGRRCLHGGDRGRRPARRTCGPARSTAGGHAVIIDAPDELRRDPWGPPPAGLAIMRRLKAAFDPAGVLNRGQFIGDRMGAP